MFNIRIRKTKISILIFFSTGDNHQASTNIEIFIVVSDEIYGFHTKEMHLTLMLTKRATNLYLLDTTA